MSVKRRSANDFDPLGDQGEHARRGAPRRRPGPRHGVDDGDLHDNVLNKPRGKAGVGLYVDAEPRVDATAMQIQTPAARLEDGDLRRAAPAAPTRGRPGWTRVGGGTVSERASASPRHRRASPTATTWCGSRELPPARAGRDRRGLAVAPKQMADAPFAPQDRHARLRRRGRRAPRGGARARREQPVAHLGHGTPDGDPQPGRRSSA